MRGIGQLLTIVALVAAFAAPAAAQDETLADIRAELAALAGELQGLRGQLVAGAGAGGFSAQDGFGTGFDNGGFDNGGFDNGGAGAASALARMDAIEQELQRLTGLTEELQFRIDRVVTDGTNRLGDLEFRVVELEGGDLSTVGTPPPLGGGATGTVTDGGGAGAPETGGTAELAIGEQADFDRAKAALDSGSFRSAADLFDTFTKTYTGGPLTPEAHYRRGLAQTGLGETTEAAKAYLEAFSSAPSSKIAPDALVELGVSLAVLGQTPEACMTLGETGTRFAGTQAALRASAEMQSLGCN